MARLTERAGLVALAAFLAVDVLLVGFAVKSTQVHVPQGGTRVDVAVSTPAADQTPTTTTSSSGPTTSGPSAGATSAIRVVPLTVGVVAIDHDTAYRFVVGSCQGASRSNLELTRNGGQSWTPYAAAFDAVMRIRVRSDQSAFAVGANAATGCTPGIRDATSVGGSWGNIGSVAGAWFRDPRDPHLVGLASGGSGKPCGTQAVVDLAVVDLRAVALCPSGKLVASSTGGTWTTVATVPGALAVAVSPSGRSYLAVPRGGSCAGVAIVDSAQPASAVGCAPAALEAVKPGTVALSVSASAGWLVVGQNAFRAGSTLADWRKS